MRADTFMPRAKSDATTMRCSTSIVLVLINHGKAAGMPSMKKPEHAVSALLEVSPSPDLPPYAGLQRGNGCHNFPTQSL